MLGVSSYCLMNRPLPEALDTLSAITGFVEVMDEGLHFISDPDLFSQYSLKLAIHAPFHGMNVASVFEPIRAASVRVMTECFAVAGTLDAPVVMHPGYYAWEPEQELSDRQFVRSLQELDRAAGEYSVSYSFENMGNMNYFNLRTPADLHLIDGAGLTLDTGHANLNHCLPAFLETRFRHMHLHDNKGRSDSHSMVGAGSIDFGPVMEAMRRRHATAVIEVHDFEGAKQSLEILRGM